MNIKPLSDRVLLRRKDAETQSAGGLFIPAAAQEQNNICVVVAVGPGRITDEGTLIEPQVGVGAEVLIGKWEGNEVKVEGDILLIVQESAILAVVEAEVAAAAA